MLQHERDEILMACATNLAIDIPNSMCIRVADTKFVIHFSRLRISFLGIHQTGEFAPRLSLSNSGFCKSQALGTMVEVLTHGSLSYL